MKTSQILQLLVTIWPYIVGIGGFIWGIIKSRYQLSTSTQTALAALAKAGITVDNISDILSDASKYVELDNAGKQAYAVKTLTDLASRNGITLKESIATDIVTWLYARLKTR